MSQSLSRTPKKSTSSTKRTQVEGRTERRADKDGVSTSSIEREKKKVRGQGAVGVGATVVIGGGVGE